MCYIKICCFRPVSIFLLAGVSLFSYASTVTSDVLGYVKSTRPAHNGSNSSYTLHSLPLRLSKEFSGNATKVSGFNITVTGTTFPNSFKDIDAEGNPLYYIEILDGTHIGLRLDIKDVSGDTITLDESVGDILDKNVSFSVTKYWTLGEIFGKEGELVGLEPYIWGNDFIRSQFDIVSCLDAKVGSNTYFIGQNPSSLGGGKRWVSLIALFTGNDSKDFSNTRIFENTIKIFRIGANCPELTIINTGALIQGKTRVPIFPGSNLVSLSYPTARTLNTSGLQESGFLAGSSFEDSDQLTMTQNGKIQQYYLRKIPNSLGGGTAWQKVGAPANSDYGNDAMFGPVQIIRKSNSSIDWVQEPPFSL